MNYIETFKKSLLEQCDRAAENALCATLRTAALPLTNYKNVVDIPKKELSYYGLLPVDLYQVQYKQALQKFYLEKHFLYDKITSTYIPLSEIVVSSYHSPQKYYAEIQNRINTLSLEAKQKNLFPLFMTLTLPSEFHKMKETKNGVLVKNPKYNGTSPKEAIKILTKKFSKLRHDRALKTIPKDKRIYFRVNEPHKDGTPHTHILLFIPHENVDAVMKAFTRLFRTKGHEGKANEIQKIINTVKNATAYVMKYINKTLPLSKKSYLLPHEHYLNAWYSKHRVLRFSSSRTLAPMSLFRLLRQTYSLHTLTQRCKEQSFKVFKEIHSNKIVEIFDGDELVYLRNENYTMCNSAHLFRANKVA